MIKSIGHVGISTPDIARLTDFYVNQMGCESFGEAGWPIGSDTIDKVIGLHGSSAKSAMLRLGEVCIELFEFKSPTPATKPNDYPASDHGISHFCFIVEDLNAEYTRLSATGMRFHSEPKSFNGAWSVYARDPDGNIIELIEMGGGDDHTIEAAAHLL